jgi:hypothetical protein
MWHREAACLRVLAREYGVSTSTVHRTIDETEAILAEIVAIHKDAPMPDVLCVTLDATETQIQRPGKDQRAYYSGKKKHHTAKTTGYDRHQILAVSQTVPGAVHDFTAYKQMELSSSNTLILADSGYQGIAKLHARKLLQKAIELCKAALPVA